MILARAIKSGLVLGIPLAFIVSSANVSAATEKQPVSNETILSRLHTANLDEVALSQMAIKRAHNSAVKQYARNLAKEHDASDKRLIILAKNKQVNLSTTSKGVSENIRTLKENVSYQNLRSLSGSKFDEEFLKLIKDEHQKMIDVIQSAEIPDDDIRKFADRELVALKSHLEKAESLTKE